jgi:glycosyltransferase involved in cell wall biosynthesis
MRRPCNADVVTVPNVVNTDHYPLASRDRIGALVYPALFTFPPNEEAARILVEDVMPLLPSMTLTLVGSGDLAWLGDFDRQRIRVTGPVPDVVPYLTNAWAMPIPLRVGGGTRLKAIEGLAAGLPIISTAKGVEGLGLEPDRDFLRGEEPREFCAQVERLRDEPEVAEGLIRRGRDTVRERFSLEAATRSITDALARLGTPT